jgi:PIN domain nuclease of toxin-antitoxin system
LTLLLDTHLLLLAAGPFGRLSEAARQLMEDSANELIFSVASVWEAAIKSAQGRDDFRVDVRLLRHRLLSNGYRELPISGEHATAAGALPPLHKDPFDRMLVGQSIVEGITLLTVDPQIARYSGPIQRV